MARSSVRKLRVNVDVPAGVHAHLEQLCRSTKADMQSILSAVIGLGVVGAQGLFGMRVGGRKKKLAVDALRALERIQDRSEKAGLSRLSSREVDAEIHRARAARRRRGQK